MSIEIAPGRHVVCIADNWAHRDYMDRHGIRAPVRGVVYTVRWVGWRNLQAFPSLTVEEILNPEVPYLSALFEPSFAVRAFRPLRRLSVDDFFAQKLPKRIEEKV